MREESALVTRLAYQGVVEVAAGRPYLVEEEQQHQGEVAMAQVGRAYQVVAVAEMAELGSVACERAVYCNHEVAMSFEDNRQTVGAAAAAEH